MKRDRRTSGFGRLGRKRIGAGPTFEAVAHHRAPRELETSEDQLGPTLVLGECLAQWFAEGACEVGSRSDFVLINNYAELPDQPPRALTDYAFALVLVPLRAILPEWDYLRLPFDDLDKWEALATTCEQRLERLLDLALRWHRESGLLTFVGGFLVPQQNPMGRLLPHEDPRNVVYMVENLNRCLRRALVGASNAYYFDLDQVASAIGKAHILDDALNASTHGGFLSAFDNERDQRRIEPPLPIDQRYELRSLVFRQAAWWELRAMFRTVRQMDQVKLVIVDLDDTLWRGVVAEEGAITDDTIEGWPMGVIEALQFLAKRGILLAVASQNDPSVVEGLWKKIFRGRLELEDFVVRKISWRPKVESIAEILDELNLLPTNAVFVDDNPRERAAAAGAFPGLRVLGGDLYGLRRVLLWSAETQVATVTAESATRLYSTAAAVRRESLRKQMQRSDFLMSLGLQVFMREMAGVADPSFVRVLELLNKTNQFNTTGERWTQERCVAHVAQGGKFVSFCVQDRLADYGLVGAMVLNGPQLSQMVMSCRVFGLDVEVAAVCEVARRALSETGSALCARLIETARNGPCRDVFRRCGFTRDPSKPDTWNCPTHGPVLGPSHVTVTWS